MTVPFTENTKVKDIVNELPKSSDVFKRHRIDFCCGGNIALTEAATAANVSLESLLSELTEVQEKSDSSDIDWKAWMLQDSQSIIDHVITQYHRPLQEELANLSPYVTKVSRVHGGHRPELMKVYDLFYEFKKEMLEHAAKEEEVVFPLMMSLENQTVENREEALSSIKELEKEHDHAGALLKELRIITSDFIPPAEACGTYRLVYKRLEMLEGETFNHVHLENNILFPRFN
ncbi:MAG: iron-sulfur cluster repair di-iron protein [Bacillota bacterium]|nr:iron-sulfur cluster repair di-iron protein [Bacillota bacterium]